MALLMVLLFHALLGGALGEVVEDKSLREPRNGMLGVYFNPQDPVSRLAAIWWSRFFEKFPNARPDVSSKPATTTRPIVEKPPAENGVTTQPGDTQTGKPLSVGWIYPIPVFPGSTFPMIPNGGQIHFYPAPSGQGQQVLPMPLPWPPSPPVQPPLVNPQIQPSLVNPQIQPPLVNPQIQPPPFNPQIQPPQFNSQGQPQPFNPQNQPQPLNPQNQPPPFNPPNQPQNVQQNQNFNQGSVPAQQLPNYQGSQQVQNFGQAPMAQQQQPIYPSNQPPPGQQLPPFNPNVGQTPVQQQQQFGNQPATGGQNTQSQVKPPNPQNGDQSQGSGGQSLAQGMQQYPNIPAGGQFPQNQQQQQQYPNPGQQSSQYQKPPSPGAGGSFSPPSYQVQAQGARGKNELTFDSISVDPLTNFQFANITDGFLQTINDTNGTAARIYQDEDSQPNVQLIPLHSMLLVFPVHASNSNDSDASSSGLVGPVVDSLGPAAIITAECDDKNGTVCAQNDLPAIALSRAVNELQ